MSRPACAHIDKSGCYCKNVVEGTGTLCDSCEKNNCGQNN